MKSDFEALVRIEVEILRRPGEGEVAVGDVSEALSQNFYGHMHVCVNDDDDDDDDNGWWWW